MGQVESLRQQPSNLRYTFVNRIHRDMEKLLRLLVEKSWHATGPLAQVSQCINDPTRLAPWFATHWNLVDRKMIQGAIHINLQTSVRIFREKGG